MQNFSVTQTILAAAIEIIVALFFGMMALDLMAGLVKLWHYLESTLSEQKQQRCLECFANYQLPDIPLTIFTKFTANIVNKSLPYLPNFLEEYPQKNAVDSEALALLIDKGKQAVIRSAAKRLGIAVRVNNRYQKLDYLRAQIKHILKFQPDEVRRVFEQLIEPKAA